MAKVGAFLLISVGVVYYIYFTGHVAGGIVPLVAQVAAYRYLVADAGLSALPLHFIYGGALLWLLAWLSGQHNRWVGLLFLPLGMLVILSTGRIALSNVFAFSAILAFIFVIRQKADWRAFAGGFALLLPVNVIFYFWRQYTSYAYIGKTNEFALLQPDDRLAASFGDESGSYWGVPETITSAFDGYSDKLSYIFRALIGGGNVPDLQQIILIVKGVMDGRLNLIYGASYFDWVRNLIASRIGAQSGPPHSVGYRVLDAYFPEKTGGPTPGMIGEAILNFWFLAPIALAVFAFGMVLLYSKAVRSQSMFAILVYCIFLVGMWSLFIKVDSSLLQGFLWSSGPISLAWLSVVGLDHAYRRLR